MELRQDKRSEHAEGDLLDTPGREKQWGEGPDTPLAARAKRSRASVGGTKGVTLTLRDQEKHIDNLKKENFNIKLRVHFLEERLAQLAPDQIDAALKQNINLKIEVQQRGMEMKKLKKLVLELERELERSQRGAGGSRERERELEEKLQERERELRELRRGHISEADDVALRDSEARNVELEEELENVRGLLEDNMEEIDRLREIVERRGDDSMAEGGESRRDRLKRRMEELEAENEDLRARIEEQNELVESRAQILEEREEREVVEDNLNALRDKLAAATIELQQKDDDIEMKNREIDVLVAEHDRIVEVVEQEWRGEVEEARGQVEELRDVLAERETESKDLRLNISELEANTNDLHAKFEAALAHLEREAEDKDAEISATNREIEKLGEQVYLLEEENDKLKEESDRIREEEAVERERLEALAAALKEEELAQHIEDLVEEVQRERDARQRLEVEMEKCDQDHDAEIRRERRALEAKESALQSALNDLARTQSLLAQRESDLDAVQSALQTLEAESKKLGESHTTARFSLQLEVDRLKRDVERLEDELSRARKGIDERENKTRDRDGMIDKLHAENRDLASQLAAQTQARLNVSEKLDGVQAGLKNAESELSTSRTKASELEQRLSKDQRSLLAAESQYRDQLTERNTLLLTIYQYMDKILGVDKTPKKGSQAETKPFTNFSVFHDNLITRLKALSQIQLDFDKRCKEAEARFTEKLTDMRKQLDNRWKQIDKFESSVKAYGEAKATWRRKYTAKEGELEALKATAAELTTQLSSSRRPAQGDTAEVKSLMARAINAEKRLTVTQNQLLHSEEKIANMIQKTVTVDSKWEARVKEYEARIKAAEEKYKRERQGGKERVVELESQIKSLERQHELAVKRSNQLENVAETNKVATGRTR
ncbi:hypothetical protein SERLA73DRAFT_170829 [Serpula lacrymans var. lacrymans S7.3]|uniref:Centrosomin N-terminal motif 1 domain-containing protein n=1 Tax=Serpula lacrymans var. lacrymans (strain S7.3) TaxID=936435 RepID=F8Q5K5_SERL3|nr:hypothetical protein SERLA73DRAFT_170829 [Serpula lacrymans var. lacrymans S7.3]